MKSRKSKRNSASSKGSNKRNKKFSKPKHMIGEYKPFSASLHKKNDPKSRRVVKEYLQKKDIDLEDNPDKYGVDLISKDGTVKVEVEHRLSWQGPEFPFNEINVPERKGKFFGDKEVSYAILNKEYTHIGIIPNKKLRKYLTAENLKENPNKYVKAGELFYKVPKSAFKWNKL